MNKLPTLLILLFTISFSLKAQEMNPEKLLEIITKVSDTVQSEGNSMRFMYKERFLICVHDQKANRMRIISPIVEREKIGEEELLNALVANFHSALDVKYALSDEIIWSVFIHPLQELSEHQVEDAISQVYLAAATFGGSYSSTHLVFPGNSEKKEEKLPEPEKILNKI